MDLEKMNVSLLMKWWWKLESHDGLWQQIVRAKYLRNKSVTDVKTRVNDSPCWKGIMKVRDIYLAGRGIKLKNGPITSFWKDPLVDKLL